jgi:hypothetical protein
MYMYIYVLVISGAFQQQKKFPYDRRINKNNDPPFVNKIVVYMYINITTPPKHFKCYYNFIYKSLQ